MTDDKIEDDAPPVPHKRLRMTLEVEAHDLPDLSRRLEQILLDVERTGLEQRQVVSGGGWFFELRITDPEQTEGRYEEQLREWSAQRRTARTAAEVTQ